MEPNLGRIETDIMTSPFMRIIQSGPSTLGPI